MNLLLIYYSTYNLFHIMGHHDEPNASNMRNTAMIDSFLTIFYAFIYDY